MIHNVEYKLKKGISPGHFSSALAERYLKASDHLTACEISLPPVELEGAVFHIKKKKDIAVTLYSDSFHQRVSSSRVSLLYVTKIWHYGQMLTGVSYGGARGVGHELHPKSDNILWKSPLHTVLPNTPDKVSHTFSLDYVFTYIYVSVVVVHYYCHVLITSTH